MGLKKEVLDKAIGFLKRGIKVFGGDKASFISAHLAEKLVPFLIQETDFGPITFVCPGKTPIWRANTLLSKEPETIEWINSFQETDVLWDIGANVGVYSLYAAVKGINVLAFEPSPGNYYLLSRNIEINQMDKRISALCIALNDATRLDSFYMANTELGVACNSFGEKIDWQGKPYTSNSTFEQTMLGFSIDDFIERFDPPFPNHIKIDVDGNEDKIVKGAEKTIKDNRIKSILIELYTRRQEYCNNVIKCLEDGGFQYYEKNKADESGGDELSDVYNFIFRRVPS